MRPRKSFARQLGRMLCLLLLHCVFSSATIIRVEEVTSGVEATPVSASLQQLEAGFVPANDDGHWSNHDFLAGITFGVMSSGIIVALLLGCQVLQVAPAGRTECQAASIEELHVPGRTEGEEVESLNYFWPRVSWLAAMLLLQSVSSLILSKFEYLVRKQRGWAECCVDLPQVESAPAHHCEGSVGHRRFDWHRLVTLGVLARSHVEE